MGSGVCNKLIVMSAPAYRRSSRGNALQAELERAEEKFTARPSLPSATRPLRSIGISTCGRDSRTVSCKVSVVRTPS